MIYYGYGEGTELLISCEEFAKRMHEVGYLYTVERVKYQISFWIRLKHGFWMPWELQSFDNFLYTKNKDLWYTMLHVRGGYCKKEVR